jgi:small subunit ribosomal protein S20
MPIIKSAQKALRQNIARRAKNKLCKQKIKSLLKNARSMASAKKTADAQKTLPEIYKALDKAAKTGVIKANTAARKKSRLARFLAKTAS